MRIIATIFSALTAIVFAGCAHHPGESLSWNDHTVLPKGESITSLNTLANNPASNRADRARAIFTLFAHHIRPGSSAADVRRVLADTNWMAAVNLYGVYALAGWIPVEIGSEDTVFCLHLFPVEMDGSWSPWVIYFRLSGKPPEGPGRRKEEALAFLHGDTTLRGNPKLVEFALCYPDTRDTTHGIRADDPGRHRIERFSRRGIHVYKL